jgi:hypothetical protein
MSARPSTGGGRAAMAAPTYEVRLEGEVPSSVLDQLTDVHLAGRELRTVLTGDFEDQAALYGFLHRLRDHGLSVVEVRRLAIETEPAEPVPEPGDEV